MQSHANVILCIIRETPRALAPSCNIRRCLLRTFSSHNTRYNPAPRAPSTTQTLAYQKGRPMTEQDARTKRRYDRELVQLMTLDALKLQHRKRKLKTKPEKILSSFKHVWQAGRNFVPGEVAKICNASGIPVNDATLFARILIRSGDVTNRVIGNRMLHQASALGSAAATIILINEAVRQQRLHLPELKPVLAQLRTLADKQDDPDALVLLGQIAQEEDRPADAIARYEKAIAVLTSRREAAVKDPDPLTDEGTDLLGAQVTAPWTALGNLRLATGDLQGAEKAFRAGALEGDDPLAYFLLANFEEKYSDTWVEYTTKAASSGHPLAAYALAKYYAWEEKDEKGAHEIEHGSDEESDQKEPAKLSPEVFSSDVPRRQTLAEAWFAIAGDGGHGPSIYESARRRWKAGHPGSAHRWLQQIVGNPGKYRLDCPQTFKMAKRLNEQITAELAEKNKSEEQLAREYVDSRWHRK